MTLADLYSAIDSAKRRGAGLLGSMTDPATLGDLATGMGRGLLTGPAEIGQLMSNLATGQPGNTQGIDQLRGLLGSPTSDAQQAGEAIGPPLKTAAKLGALAAGKIPGLLGAHIVFHGSPYQFDKFDMSKIGTGEGAQAYGHGLYFAEDPVVAKTYQAKVSAMQQSGSPTIGGKPINWDDPTQAAAFEAWRHNGDRSAAADFYEKTFKNTSGVTGLLRSDKPLPSVDPPGALYKADINADPAHYLDWDKPLSEQHPKVQDALLATGDPVINAWRNNGAWEHASGQQAYRNLADGITNRAAESGVVADASARLNALGIPGIKYKDAGSRGTDAGTHNYVVFDDSLINNLGPQP